MPRNRPVGVLGWIVRILFALVLAGGGILIGRVVSGDPLLPSSGPSTPAGLIGPQAPPDFGAKDAARAVKNACASLLSLDDSISYAADVKSTASLPALARSPGLDPLRSLDRVKQPAYQSLVMDASALFNALRTSEETRTLSAVEAVADELSSDCTSLGYPGGPT